MDTVINGWGKIWLLIKRKGRKGKGKGRAKKKEKRKNSSEGKVSVEN